MRDGEREGAGGGRKGEHRGDQRGNMEGYKKRGDERKIGEEIESIVLKLQVLGLAGEKRERGCPGISL